MKNRLLVEYNKITGHSPIYQIFLLVPKRRPYYLMHDCFFPVDRYLNYRGPTFPSPPDSFAAIFIASVLDCEFLWVVQVSDKTQMLRTRLENEKEVNNTGI